MRRPAAAAVLSLALAATTIADEPRATYKAKLESK